MKIEPVRKRSRPRPDDDEPQPLRAGAPGTSYFCVECSAWRETLDCPVCGAELDDGVTDERGQGVGAAFSPSTKAWGRALLLEITPSLPGGLVCGLLTFVCLTYALPFAGPDRAWPGQLAATFVCAYWLLERTRAAHQRGVDLDISQVGISLLRALLVFPILAGVASGHWAGLPVAALLAPLAPLLLGAIVSDDLRELSPASLWSAFRATAGYFRVALVTSACLGLSTTILWRFPEAGGLWRAALATLGVTLAGTVVGVARRGAEHVPEDDD